MSKNKHTQTKINPVEQKKFHKNLCNILVIIILGFTIYGNTIGNDYALDDDIVITNNQFTKQGISGLGGIFGYDSFVGRWMLEEPNKSPQDIQNQYNVVSGGRYRPLSIATFALEVELFGLNPHISHFVNIILFILLTLLLFSILKKIIPPQDKNTFLSVAFVASLLFLLHPIHTEVVANIKGRDEILALLGALGALWFSLKFVETNKKKYLIFSAISFFLGLLSKENTITFLLVIPLTIFIFVKHERKQNTITCVPLILATITFLAIRTSILGTNSNISEVSELMNNPFAEANNSQKYATIFYTLGRYVQLLLFPHPLTYDYYPYHIALVEWNSLKAILPLLLYIAMIAYGIYGLLRKKNIPTYCIWLYIIPLTIVSNIFFSIGSFMNERFIFASSIAFCILLAWLMIDKIPSLWKKSKYLIYSILVVVMILYSAKTIARNHAWENDFVLRTTDVVTSCNSAKSNHDVGCFYFLEAEKPENQTKHDKFCRLALNHLQKSITIYPQYADSYYLMGRIYGPHLNNLDSAIYCFSKSYELEPNIQCLEDLATAYAMTSQYEKALECFLTAFRTDSANKIVAQSIAYLYQDLKQPDKATEYQSIADKL